MRYRVMLGLLFTIAIPCGTVAAEGDRATKLVGSWTCSTVQGNTSAKTVVRNPDGSIGITNVITTSDGQSGTIRETYAFDASSGTWKLTAIPDAVFPFGNYDATAKPWTQSQWIFDGSEPMKSTNGTQTTTEVRLVFTDLFPAGFRREYQVATSGAWRDISEEVCKKPTS